MGLEVTRAQWSSRCVSLVGKFPFLVKEVCHAQEYEAAGGLIPGARRNFGCRFVTPTAVGHLANPARPVPGASITKAQTSAEAIFAIWNSSRGMAKIPAVRGATARSGPMKRLRKTPHAPHREKNRSPRSARFGWRDSGQTRKAACLNRYLTAWDTQSPRVAPTAAPSQIGQNFNPLVRSGRRRPKAGQLRVPETTGTLAIQRKPAHRQ